MAEYIERDFALDVIKRTSGDYAAAFAEIANHPAADVAPVVHGEWYQSSSSLFHYCSNCLEDAMVNRNTSTEELTQNCPHCGAKMEKKIKNV